MIQVLLFLWLAMAILIIHAQKMARIVIYFGIFSLITSFCFLMLGAPDVAMAEAAISVFTTIFFIVCFEKYYNMNIDSSSEPPPKRNVIKLIKGCILPFVFTAFLFALFLHFIPDATIVNAYLKDLYIARFMYDVGGENPVTAIYLVYRVYDTLFEALMLVISVVAVSHMSWFSAASISDGKHSDIEGYGMAVFTVRIVCPLMLVFGIYLIVNGQFTPGGGFQGGLAVATFFICRYMIYNIYDVRIHRVMRIEELIFAATILLAVFIVFLGAAALMLATYLQIFRDSYLVAINALIGMKVACAFFILLYRYIAVERK